MELQIAVTQSYDCSICFMCEINISIVLFFSWPYHNIKLWILYQLGFIKFAKFYIRKKVTKKYNAFSQEHLWKEPLNNPKLPIIDVVFMSYQDISLMIGFLLGYNTKVAGILNL